MSSTHYLPRKDAGFDSVQGAIYAQVALHAAAWLIPEQAVAAIEAGRRRWNSAYSTYLDPAKRTKAVVSEKNDARRAYEAVLRPFVQGWLMHNPWVTGADRRDMSLPVYDRTPTPVAAPKSRPELEIDFSQIARHTLRVRDSESKSAGRPAHVAGFEIWRRVGGHAQPAIDEMLLIGQATRSPHTLEYASTYRSQPAWYALRWVNTRGEKGPWSEIVSAIIA
jgi:hypothetical protein